MQPFQIRLSAEDRANLEALAARDGIALADVVRRVLRAEGRRAALEDAALMSSTKPRGYVAPIKKEISHGK